MTVAVVESRLEKSYRKWRLQDMLSCDGWWAVELEKNWL